nr:hypothetical protein [Accumulibacter sp.]
MPAPRRPHAEEARQIGAQGFLVGGQRLDRLGRSVEQGTIAHARRLREKVPQRLRNGESQPEVMGGNGRSSCLASQLSALPCWQTGPWRWPQQRATTGGSPQSSHG